VQFFPDATRLSSAATLALAGGKQLEGIDFRMAAKAVAHLHGRVVIPDAVPPESNVQVELIPQDLPDQSAIIPLGVLDLQFETNAMAGPYLVTADLAVEDHAYRALERIELPPAGQEITMHLDRGIDLAGRLDLEGARERPSKPYRVTLVSGDTPRVAAQPSAEVHPDGSFLIRNVVPGIWDINPEPVPEGGYIKSMRLGDQDVLAEDMVIGPRTRDPLRIVLSTRGAVVTGTVVVPNHTGRSARASVLLAPSGKYAHVLSFYGMAADDDSGHFALKGITPGLYKLYAFEEMEPYAYGDPDFLKPYEASSEEFEIAEGAQLERRLPLIAAGGRPAGEK
jgi:hypothetical protein